MRRRPFLVSMAQSLAAMTTLSAFKTFTDSLEPQETLMPVLFIGHGSPMNGIEDNAASRSWEKLGQEIPMPKAVLVVSAHWYTKGTKITAMTAPPTIHDFGGFPKELFAVQYPAPGDPKLAAETKGLIHTASVELDHEWGLDHGAWTILRRMYPKANIPILQLSIDYSKGAQFHYDLAKELAPLRRKGVLILGSGNMVHNLRMVDWNMIQTDKGFDWAYQINDRFKQLITEKDHKALVQYEKLGREAQMAIPTPDHYLPLLYTLGLQTGRDGVSFFNDYATGGSLTMTSVKIG